MQSPCVCWEEYFLLVHDIHLSCTYIMVNKQNILLNINNRLIHLHNYINITQLSSTTKGLCSKCQVMLYCLGSEKNFCLLNILLLHFTIEPGTPAHEEPIFLVFYTMLLNLFTMFCFQCKSDNSQVSMKRNGTMVTVVQTCTKCIKKPFIWRNQPYALGRYPDGNVLFSFAVLMAGTSTSCVLLLCKHMKLSIISIHTFFLHQKTFLFPAVLKYWETYRASMIEQLRR